MSMTDNRRIAILLLAAGCTTVVMLMLPPVLQAPAYHRFIDQRAFFGIPRFLDIATNLPFLIVGIAGLLHAYRGGLTGARRSWMVFFAGVALVGIGSAYYHADPKDGTLVWDRLPMTAAFMGILVAVLSERIGSWIEVDYLEMAVFAGIMSVLWWAVLGDLRPYILVQAMPLIIIPAALLLYPGNRADNQLIMFSLMWYVLAKVTEHFDTHIYSATGQIISGHSLKHLAAAAGCAVIIIMIWRREVAAGTMLQEETSAGRGVVKSD